MGSQKNNRPVHVTVPRICPMVDKLLSYIPEGDLGDGMTKEGLVQIGERIKEYTNKLRSELEAHEKIVQSIREYEQQLTSRINNGLFS